MTTLKASVRAAFVCASLALLLVHAPAAADVVHSDDVIINGFSGGSLCVGQDCVVDVEFSFATILLKENNLRIYFNDTSGAPGFPTNDWEIIANDSNNGGESFLGFADRGPGSATTSTSGVGTCVGGTNNGLACGLPASPGGSCEGVCNGGLFNGTPCFPDPSTCSDNGGTCENAGVCTAPGGIVFKIEAGAPTDALVIDSGGSVDVGTNMNVTGDLNVTGAITGASIGSTAKAGIILPGAFGGKPLTATVVFASPFTVSYAVVLTPMTASAKKRMTATLISKTPGGFTVNITDFKNLVEVDWIARPVGE